MMRMGEWTMDGFVTRTSAADYVIGDVWRNGTWTGSLCDTDSDWSVLKGCESS
ncbi:unnamed protein product [Symbiodinium necroappetens]|uniref:Uncharacterized protein n=1 Tax=Symbiodinium necroappetens TaxID=1628268 RepID=A0A812J0P1_9DINO|nr:unnamed protein product [Symbiodinium necroappetens]